MAEVTVDVTVNLKADDALFGRMSISATSTGGLNRQYGYGIVDPNGLVLKVIDLNTPDGSGLSFSAFEDLADSNGNVIEGDYVVTMYASVGSEEKQTFDITVPVALNRDVDRKSFSNYDCKYAIRYGGDESVYPDDAAELSRTWSVTNPAIPGEPAYPPTVILAPTYQTSLDYEGVSYSATFKARWEANGGSATLLPNISEDVEFTGVPPGPGDTAGIASTAQLSASLDADQYVEVSVPNITFENDSLTSSTAQLCLDPAGASPIFSNTIAYTATTSIPGETTMTASDFGGLTLLDVPLSATIYLVITRPADGIASTSVTTATPFVLATKSEVDASWVSDYGFVETHEIDVFCNLAESKVNDCIDTYYESLETDACKAGTSATASANRDELFLLNLYMERRTYYYNKGDGIKAAEYQNKIAKLVGCSCTDIGPAKIPPSGILRPDLVIIQDWTDNGLQFNTSVFANESFQYRIWNDRIDFRGMVTVSANIADGDTEVLLDLSGGPFSADDYALSSEDVVVVTYVTSLGTPWNNARAGYSFFRFSDGQFCFRNDSGAALAPLRRLVISGSIWRRND